MEPDLAPGGEGQHLFRVDVERVGGGRHQVGIGDLQGDHEMGAGQVFGDGVAHLGVDLVHLGQRQTETRGNGGHDLIVSHQFLADERFPQRRGLFGVGFPKLQHDLFGGV